MVRDANVKQAASEKQLKEAQGKVCEVFKKKKNNLKQWRTEIFPESEQFFFHIVEGHKIASNYQYYIFLCLACRLMFCKQKWRHSRLWCWRPHLLHQIASCIHSCSLQVPGDRTNRTSGTRVPAVHFHSHLQKKKFPFSLCPKRTER